MWTVQHIGKMDDTRKKRLEELWGAVHAGGAAPAVKVRSLFTRQPQGQVGSTAQSMGSAALILASLTRTIRRSTQAN